MSSTQLLEVGSIHYRNGQIDAARVCFVKACEAAPESGEAQLWLSRALRKLGRKEEALEHAVRADALDRNSPTVQHHLGLCLMDLQKFAAAADAFQSAIALDPEVATIHHGLGLCLCAAGEFEGAIRAFKRSLSLDPSSNTGRTALAAAVAKLDSITRERRILLQRGKNLIAAGNYNAAVVPLERAWSLDGIPSEASVLLSLALQKSGRLAEACGVASAAVSENPSAPEALEQLGWVCLDASRCDEAATWFKKAISETPKGIFAYHGLAQALRRLERYVEEVGVLRRALDIDPSDELLRRNLCEALLLVPDASAALAEAVAFVRMLPGSFEARCSLAQSHLVAHRSDLAEEQVAEALKIGPANGGAAFRLATILRAMGRIVETESWTRKSIEMQPVQGSAYSLVSYLRRVRSEDAGRVAKMQELCTHPALSVNERSLLHYGLGKAHEDLERFEEAMSHYDEANRLAYLYRYGAAKFDRRSFTDTTDRTVGAVEAVRARRRNNESSASDVPIFVFGMIRSGTTLVDQILSSHREVGSVGESRFWLDRSTALLFSPGRDDILAAAGDYVALLQQGAPAKRRIVDKMPGNYLIAPLLHAVFPNAKFIHVTRNPADTCLSIYTTINLSRIDWAHDKANIALAYREYLRTMVRWRAVIPASAIKEVAYEDLVANPESVSRDLVAFCGVEWDDACMKPEENKRSVLTPSAWQVRQPIYKTSVERWKSFEPWLREFAQLRR